MDVFKSEIPKVAENSITQQQKGSRNDFLEFSWRIEKKWQINQRRLKL